jgi:tape measure domain-containing protein
MPFTLANVSVAVEAGKMPLEKPLHRSLSGIRAFTAFAGKHVFSAAKAAGLAFAGAVAGGAYGFKKFSDAIISTGSSFEDLRIQLDTITKGQGAEVLDMLNTWALKMPVDTQKAVEAYKNMRAMGLDPTLEQMTTLVDTMSALGGGTETLMGIARALGQIQTKGKPSLEELYQLAERGVPIFEILQDRLGLTAEQVVDIANSGVSSADVIQAAFAGMAERFGGASTELSGSWGGMVRTLSSYWVEFKRLVAESGVFEHLKETLRGVLDTIEGMSQSGELETWAQGVGDMLVSVFSYLKRALVSFGDALQGIFGNIQAVIDATKTAVGFATDIARSQFVEIPLETGKLAYNLLYSPVQALGYAAGGGDALGFRDWQTDRDFEQARAQFAETRAEIPEGVEPVHEWTDEKEQSATVIDIRERTRSLQDVRRALRAGGLDVGI